MALHRHLDGKGPQPLAFYISRLCEEFGKSPLEIMEERAQLPDGFLEEVIEARAYASTHAAYAKKDPKDSPWWQLVTEIDHLIAEEESEHES